jgi:hypothetical protein
MYIAKSGRKYRSIPEGMDVETWDAMTFLERIKHLGLLSEEKSTWLEDAKARQKKRNKS